MSITNSTNLTNLTSPSRSGSATLAGVSDLTGVDRRRSDITGRDITGHDGFDAHYEREIQGRDDRPASRTERTERNDHRDRSSMRDDHGRDDRVRPDRSRSETVARRDPGTSDRRERLGSRDAAARTRLDATAASGVAVRRDDVAASGDVAEAESGDPVDTTGAAGTGEMADTADGVSADGPDGSHDDATPESGDAVDAVPVLVVAPPVVVPEHAETSVVAVALSTQLIAGATGGDATGSPTTDTNVGPGSAATGADPTSSGAVTATSVAGTSPSVDAGPAGAAPIAADAPEGAVTNQPAIAASGIASTESPEHAAGAGSDTMTAPAASPDATTAPEAAARTSGQPGSAGRGGNPRVDAAFPIATGEIASAAAPAVTAAAVAQASAVTDERADLGSTSSSSGPGGAPSVPTHGAAFADTELGTTAGLTAAGEAADVARSEPRPAREVDLLRGPGLDRMSIDLSDEGLGPLTLQAASGAGGLHLRLAAGDRAVGDALASAADELRRDLEAGGTRLGSLDVGHRDARSGGGFAAPNQQRSIDSRRSTRSTDPTPIGAIGTTPARVQGAHAGAVGVDLMI